MEQFNVPEMSFENPELKAKRGSDSRVAKFLKGFMKLGSLYILKSCFILLFGSILYYKTQVSVYAILFWASLFHLVLEIIFYFLSKHPLQDIPKNLPRQVHLALLGISFALYAYVAMNIWGSLAIISIILMGGFLDWLRYKIEHFYFISGFLAVLLLILSVFTTTIPNIILLDKDSAAKYAEKHKFFLRGRTAQEDAYFGTDQVIIEQSPRPGEGFLGTNLVFAFRGHHMTLDFLPFPVWHNVNYRLGAIPEISFTGIRKGHGSNPNPLRSITEKDERIEVCQYTRIFGTLKNWPEKNNSLYLRLFAMPDMQSGHYLDKEICRWYAQPGEPNGKIGHFSDRAEMSIDCEQGKWYADVFFGNPYNTDWRFKLRAIITSENYQRGQIFTDEELERRQSRISLFVKKKTDKTLIVYREAKRDDFE